MKLTRNSVCAAASSMALGSVLCFPTLALADEGVPPRSVVDLDITELVNVRVSPFDVSSALDNGYRASNSVTGSASKMLFYRVSASRWRDHKMSVELMGKNLADEHYRPSQSSRSRPRELLLTLKAGF